MKEFNNLSAFDQTITYILGMYVLLCIIALIAAWLANRVSKRTDYDNEGIVDELED